MSKDELFSFLKTHGNYCGERLFSYHFPDFYKVISSISFPKDFCFRQKLYHYFNDDFNFKLGYCVVCGKNRCRFISFTDGYKQHCSKECTYGDKNRMLKSQETCIKKYGTPFSFQSENNKTKSKKTCIEKYGVENPAQSNEVRLKIEETNKRNHNGVWNFQEERFIENSRIKFKEKYDSDWYTKSLEYKQLMIDKNDDRMKKSKETKSKNKSFNSSNVEREFELYLQNNSIEYIKQYNSERYPFNCDFYIIKYDLFLEINGHWTHNDHLFNENNLNDIKIVELWKSKDNRFYDIAIKVWTIYDVKKANIAKENKLNYLVVYSKYVGDVIYGFEQKIKELV